MIVFKKQDQSKILKRVKKLGWHWWRKLKSKIALKWWMAGLAMVILLTVVLTQKFNLRLRIKNKIDLARETLITGYYRLTVKPRESLLLDIKFKDVKQLAKKRTEALNLGVLLNSDQDLVPADIRYGEQTIPVEIRLKGDWLDHLRGNKWSLRVETQDDEVFKGMRRFSLQVPEARNFINEWLFLKVLADEGLISLNYDFLKVTINGENSGIYALEEHFSKEVIERNERREGPILKFNADRFWQTVSSFGGKNRFTAREHLIDGYYFKSLIEPFQQAQLESDPALAELLQLAVNKLQAYREGVLNPDEVFDYEAWGKYLVLADIFGADHGFFWENYRFYFNPVTAKFEPIPFDNEPGKMIEHLAIHITEPEPLTQMFEDPEFVKEYVKIAKQYAKQEYVGSKLSEYSQEIDYYTRLLRQDYPDYRMEPMGFFENVDFIKQSLLIDQGVRVTVPSNTATVDYLEVENLLNLPVEVVKVSRVSQTSTNLLLQKKVIAGDATYSLPKKERVYLKEPVATDDKSLEDLVVSFRLLGVEDQEEVKTVKPQRSLITDRDWQAGVSPKSVGFIQFDSQANAYVVPAGKWVLNKLVTIPVNSKLYVAAGANIDVVKNGGLVSYSPVEFDGQELEPIKIYSSDNQGQGLLVIKGGKSQINYTEFSQLRPITSQGYTNTGAVVFYETEVEIKNSNFLANESEDQLNIVRSNFLLDELRMAQASSDGLDVDFGNGQLVNCSFMEMANDAVDFSGSRIKIDGLLVNGAGDKGISVGEKSVVEANKIEIINARLGVASKDLSEVNLGDQVKFENLEVGLAAYQKKPEFGPAYINQDLIEAKNVKTGFVIEKGSVLKQPLNSVVKGNEKNVGDRFQ